MMSDAILITEIEEDRERFSRGDGYLELCENMPEELILKLIKKSVKKAQGASFTVRMIPDWNEPEDTENS